MSLFRRVASTLVALVAIVAAVGISATPAQAAYPYCNTVTLVKADYSSIEVLYPAYRDPWRLHYAPTLYCDMARINESPTSTQRQAIIQIQKTLKICYAKGITVDGLYGPNTRQAVREVQASIGGLVVDGWAGPNTRKAMKHMTYGWGGCRKRHSAGILSANHYRWYMYYGSPNWRYPLPYYSQ